MKGSRTVWGAGKCLGPEVTCAAESQLAISFLRASSPDFTQLCGLSLYDENMRAWIISQKSVFPNCFTAYKARPGTTRPQQSRPPARAAAEAGKSHPPAIAPPPVPPEDTSRRTPPEARKGIVPDL